MVFQYAEKSARICQAAHVAARSRARLLAKIGYLQKEPLEEFVLATKDYLDGWTAINTIPVRAHRVGVLGFYPAYDSLERRVGLAGPAIFSRAFECLKGLVDIRERHKLSNKVIVSVGGVDHPEKVALMLDTGADAVQAANVFFDNPTFGVDVHQALADRSAVDGRNLRDYREVGVRYWGVAVMQLDLKSDEELAIAAHVLSTWQGTFARAAAARRGDLPASVDYFVQTIRMALASRPRD